MTVASFISYSTGQLEDAGISSARLDTLIMLEDITGRDRAWLLAHPETNLAASQMAKLKRWIKRRADHEPLAYIRGFSEFYGRRFRVGKRVLEPRPESETMIDLLKEVTNSARKQTVASLKIADVGTGTGCLGITAALELPHAKVDLYDIDSSCLAVAKHNCSLHELTLNIRKRDLLNRPLNSYDVVLANLPYVPDHWQINQAAAHEPKLAIFGGKDGLDHYRRLFAQLQNYGWSKVHVFCESLPPQHDNLAKIAASHDFKLVRHQDFIQVFSN